MIQSLLRKLLRLINPPVITAEDAVAIANATYTQQGFSPKLVHKTLKRCRKEIKVASKYGMRSTRVRFRYTDKAISISVIEVVTRELESHGFRTQIDPTSSTSDCLDALYIWWGPRTTLERNICDVINTTIKFHKEKLNQNNANTDSK